MAMTISTPVELVGGDEACIHSWLVEATDSPKVVTMEGKRWLPAVCKTCGGSRLFPASNEIDSSFWWNEGVIGTNYGRGGNGKGSSDRRMAGNTTDYTEDE